MKTVVLGLSMDSAESHRRFKEKHVLPFPLLSDPDGKVCKKYGVIKEKTMYGKTYRGIERSTFLIDEGGAVREVWRKVSPKGHADRDKEALGGQT